MTIVLTIGVIALAACFYGFLIMALVRGRIPDFGNDILRPEQPGKFWLQIGLYALMATGATIYALALIGDRSK